MSKTFERYAIPFLHKVARGRKIEYNATLKAFTIKINSWFTRTIFLNDLVDAWEQTA